MAVAAVASALVGGAVAGAVAVSTSGNNTPASSSSASSSVTTAAVVRTTLTTSVQEGGSIGYAGSSTIAAPSGASAQQVAQAQEAVTQDQESLAADEQAESDASTTDDQASAQQVASAQEAVTQDQQTLAADEQAESDAVALDNEAIATAQTNLNTDRSTLSSDQAKETEDCAGSGASSAACSQDAQKVSQDQVQLTQAQQQLVSAQLTANHDHDQNQAKVVSDQTRLQGDQATVASLQATAQSTANRDHDQNQAKVVSDQTRLQGDQATLASLQATAVDPGTTYTSLPNVGDIIKEDQSLYSLSNEPVPLLYGAIPAYRAFSVGMSDGADVGQLTHDLIALGYGTGLTQSNHYSSATAGAVERWQRVLDLPATGEILLGQVVFEPGPIRVTAVTPSVGSSVGGGGGGASAGAGDGTVLTATSTTPIVTVDLDVSQEYLVKPGEAVSIVLPNGTSSVGGHIETVGNVATCPSGGGTGSGTGAQSGSSSASTSTCSSGGSGTDSGPTVPVTITLDSTPELATLDQAPVNVNITTQTANDVLAVPVNALLALQGGGYGVDVVTGSTSRLVGITTGLYANNMVQVSGSGIRAGMRVQVPSS